MFIDHVKIYVAAGKGGDGCQCFYRDKYNRQGRPDGGDGGDGADVILKADKHLRTLLDFKYRSRFSGGSGSHGSGKNQRGKGATALIINVPCGTLVQDAATQCLLRDLDEPGKSVVVAKGGRGGSGNQHKREASPGKPGEERELILDLKLIADVGLVGFPNSGKSTLISAISNAHPKVAPYPFTTKEPALGVVMTEKASFVVADIPGLIENSHRGKGLGDKFLRHIERTRILIHVVDIASTEARDPFEDYRTINNELKLYASPVTAKEQILAANKMDLEAAEANLKQFRRKVKRKIYPISALKKSGLEDLIEGIAEALQKNSN